MINITGLEDDFRAGSRTCGYDRSCRAANGLPACREAEIAYRTVGLPLDTPLVGQAVAYAHAKRD